MLALTFCIRNFSESLRHARIYLKALVAATGIREGELCSRIGSAFHRILQFNGITARYEFKDIAHLHTLKGFALIKFIAWFPQILSISGISLGAVRPEIQRTFELRISSTILATKYSLTVEEVRRLEAMYKDLADRCCRLYPEFCVLKSHLVAAHLGQGILRLGIPRLCWCFRPEGMIRSLKEHYSNTNNRSLSKSITTRWCLSEAVGSFCKLRCPSLTTGGRSITTDFGDLTAGRFATTVLGGVCTLMEVLKVLSGEQLKVRVHGSVCSSGRKRIARLSSPQNRPALSGVENVAPCVVVSISDSNLVEVITVTDEAHMALIQVL